MERCGGGGVVGLRGGCSAVGNEGERGEGGCGIV